MEQFIKKNINIILAIFILIQPIIDLLTGLCLHVFNINFTVGIIIRIMFLFFIIIITLFTFKKKKILIPYFIIGIYFIFYIIGVLLFKDNNLFQELQGLIKVFYFPILFISLYSIKDEIRISSLTLLTTLFLYLFLIFIPLILGIGFKSYEITKAGTLGFFNSANEISGIISLLTPVMLIVFITSKKIIPILIFSIIYLVVILMVGTKTPLLSLGITLIMAILYFWNYSFKEKKYKNIIISFILIIISVLSLIIIIPKTNFYKNIKTHLDYLKLDNITEVFTDKELIDHFIFSQRLTFLEKKSTIYNKAPLYQQLFGIGYINNKKVTKLIEIDYFDILYSHGIIGFIIYFSLVIYIIYKVLNKAKKLNFETQMFHTSFLLIIILSFFTGHIITAPSVSLLVVIIILSLIEKSKKDLLFASKFLNIGGIEIAQVNLLNSLDYNKYNVTLILEEKKGSLLSKLNENVKVKELKVSNCKITVLRKIINLSRQITFKIFNYHNYDFSCCYTTYSYSCNKIAQIASINNAFYVHSDYNNVYKNELEFKEFFDSRKITNYKHLIFVSNESKNSFLKYYKELEKKTKVINNLIDVEEIKNKSKENISETKPKNKKLFVFVGRLDDSSKKLKRAINLVKEIKEINLWIIGDGPDRKMYEDYTKKLKLTDRITFTGKKSNPYPYMIKADYIILTSDYEGFPVTYLEAITLNKDIITTIPTSDELIDMKDYAHIIEKDDKKMVNEVKDILKENRKKKKIDLSKYQKKRLEELEKIFNE